MRDKIALVGDPHFGLKDSSPGYFAYQRTFFDEVLVPQCQEHGVNDIVFLGDMFHSRNTISIRMFHDVRRLFLYLKTKGFDCYALLGNHDLCYKNSYEINSAKMMLGDLFFWTGSDGYLIQGNSVLFDWRNTREEYLELFEKVKRSTKNNIEYVFGHFEIVGAKQSRHVVCETGLSVRDITSVFEGAKIFSGHIHIPQQIGDAKYLGVPFYQSWAEHENRLGFTILDKKTGKETACYNPFPLFVVVDADAVSPDSFETTDPGYRLEYRIVFKDPDNETKAQALAEKIKETGHSAVVMSDSVMKNLKESGIIDIGGSSMESLVEKYFMEKFEAPDGWTPDDRKAFFHAFIELYEETKNNTDNTESL